jgi:hypothetical protein
MQIILAFDFHTIAEECLQALSLGPAGVADHLCDLASFEEFLQ